MTDISKYKNVSLSKKTYDKAEQLSSCLLDVPISKTQVITLGVNLVEKLHQQGILHSQLKAFLSNTQVSFQKLQQLQEDRNANTCN